MKDSNGNEHVWRRVTIIVLLPLTIFLWMTGWTLYWIGAQRMPSRTAKKIKHQLSKKVSVKSRNQLFLIAKNFKQ